VAIVVAAWLLTALGTGRSFFLPAASAGQPAPEDVRGLVARPGNRSATLTWEPAEGADVVEYVVTRSKALEQGQGSAVVVYRGSATEFTDSGLRNGARYRYTVFTLDVMGNTSAGAVVAVVAKAPLLVRPREGQPVDIPIEFAWVPAQGATYYNIQIFRLGGRDSAASSRSLKMLSAWPGTARFTLGSEWTYDGRAYEARPGRYAWYVWPGLGKRGEARYGKLLGQSVFVVAARADWPQ
jgi:hypothetical protein